MSINFQGRYVKYQNIQSFPKYSYDLIKGAESTIENYAKHNSLSIKFMPAEELPNEGKAFLTKEDLTDAVGIEVKENLIGTFFPVEKRYEFIKAADDNKKGNSFLRTLFDIIQSCNHESSPIKDMKCNTYRKLLLSDKIQSFYRRSDKSQFNRFY